ncbi:MAG: glycosyltransferase family 39 protein [Proteobacteria bacterium]|nr:glycosyltransferase family 39 protein [Pseudomonadota bacterium]
MSRRSILIVFFAALALRLVYLGLVHDGPDSLRMEDPGLYERRAGWFLIAGDIVTKTPAGEFVPFTERVPGYIVYLALFRALFGDNPLWPVLGQAVLDSLTCVLIAWLAAGFDRRLALPAGLIAAANLNMIAHAGLVLNDSLFLLPFTAALVATLSYLRTPSLAAAATAGGSIACAMLIRPVVLYFPPILFAAFAIAAWRRRLGFGRTATHLFACALAIAILISPQLLRNAKKFDHYALASQGGGHALRWVVPLAREYVWGVPFDRSQEEMGARVEAYLARQGLSGLPDNPFEVSEIEMSVAAEALREMGVLDLAKAWGAGAAINPFTPSIIAAPKIRAMDRPDFYDTQSETVVERIWLLLSGTRNPPFTALAVLAVLLTVILRGAEFAAMARIGRTVATGGPVPPGGRRLHPGRDRTDCRGQIPIAGVKYRLPGSNTDCLSSQL